MRTDAGRVEIWNTVVTETRTDKLILFSATALFCALLLLGVLLQYHYGGALFFQRVIAGLAGCF